MRLYDKTITYSHTVGFLSTGGLGNNIAFLLAPLVASAGVSIFFLSAPSLFPDNTPHKISSIPGLKTKLNHREFKNQLKKIGAAFSSIPEEIYPDSTLHKENFHPVKAKVLAASVHEHIIPQQQRLGGRGIVFDVKVGQNSWFRTIEEARLYVFSLKKTLSRKKLGCSFVISNMDQPLGSAIGNSLELQETIEVLKKRGPFDLLKLALALGSEMLLLAKKASSITEAKLLLRSKIENGKGLEKLKEIIEAQHGNSSVVDNYELLPRAKSRKRVEAEREGFVSQINMKLLSYVQNTISSGTNTKKDQIYPGAGLIICKKTGDRVCKGEALVKVYLNEEKNFAPVEKILKDVFLIQKKPPDFKPFIIENIK